MLTVLLSLHPSCLCQSIFVKFNLDISNLLPYYCEDWHFQDVDAELIRGTADIFD